MSLPFTPDRGPPPSLCKLKQLRQDKELLIQCIIDYGHLDEIKKDLQQLKMEEKSLNSHKEDIDDRCSKCKKSISNLTRLIEMLSHEK